MGLGAVHEYLERAMAAEPRPEPDWNAIHE
jgi:hypothetical protein